MGVGIQCCKKNEVQGSLAIRQNIRVDPFASKSCLCVGCLYCWMTPTVLIYVEQNLTSLLFIWYHSDQIANEKIRECHSIKLMGFLTYF